MSTNKPAEFNFYLNTQGPRGRQGAQGPQGVSPTITIGQNNANSFTLVITDANGTFETPNLRGNLVDVSDNGSYVRYQPSDGTLYTSDLEQATTSTFGGVRFATEDNLLDDISSGVVISPSDLQDYLAAKLTAGDNITITKDDETGIITIASTDGGSGGTTDYTALTNKPQINSVELTGNKSLTDIGAQKAFTVQAPLTFKSAQTGGVTLYGFTQSGDTLVPTVQTTVTVGDNTTYPPVTVTNGFTANITNQSWTPDCGILVPFTNKQMLMYDCTTRPFVFLGKLDDDGKFISSVCIWMLDNGDVMRPALCYNPTMGADTINYLAAFRNYNDSTISGTVNSIGSVDRAFINFGNYTAANNYSIDAMGSNGSETVHCNSSATSLDDDLPHLENITHALIVGFDTSKGSIKASNFGVFAVDERFSKSSPSQQPVAMMQDNPNLITIGPNSDTLGLNIDNNTIKVNEDGQLYANINATDFQEKFTPVEPLNFNTIVELASAGYSRTGNEFTANNTQRAALGNDNASSTGNMYVAIQNAWVNSVDLDNSTLDTSIYIDVPFTANRFYYFNRDNALVVLGQKTGNVFKPIYVATMPDYSRSRGFVTRITQGSSTTNIFAEKTNTFVATNIATNTSIPGFFVKASSGTVQDIRYGGTGSSYVTFALSEEQRSKILQCNIARFFLLTTSPVTYQIPTERVEANSIAAVDIADTLGFPTYDDINTSDNFIPLQETSSQLILSFDTSVIPNEYILPVATTTSLGGVKPDGTTITVTSDGTIASVGGGSGGTTDYTALTNKPQINSVELTGNKSLTDLGAQASTDNTLTTTAKTIVGAINELVTRIAALETQVTSLNSIIDGQTGGGTDA